MTLSSPIVFVILTKEGSWESQISCSPLSCFLQAALTAPFYVLPCPSKFSLF